VKEQKSIPVGKVQRATRFIATGAKIGGNYLRHYGKKLVDPSVTRDELHQNNATDIYQSLSELKGSALKVAQMLSMDKNLLPTAYQQQFAMAQYSAPPLSYPLVVRTFEKHFQQPPTGLFDTFSREAANAASIGQVHKATKNGNTLAVKVQYPGVADSVRSDLAMVKPIALRMFNLNAAEYDEFIQEVETRLLEETNYTLELERSKAISTHCAGIDNLKFPRYHAEWSSPKVLTMDWLEGEPLGECLKRKSLSREEANRIGQALWDFYHFQIHQLKTLHADPHPGNFIVTPEKILGVIDFGCVKVIPESFYNTYFQLLDNRILQQPDRLERVFFDLRFLYVEDSPAEQAFFRKTFIRLVELLGRPFTESSFDFSDEAYFSSLYAFGEELSSMKEIRDSKRARGVKDALYINRTYYGLYNLLHQLNATVTTHRWIPEKFRSAA
jgi:predicted unusual protein kinase regulating ubiquinone biosynthesis (AarF/ABC1/UbiB family)